MSTPGHGEEIKFRDRPVPEIMPFLREIYGRGILAYAIQEKPDISKLKGIISGDNNPDPEQEARLRDMVDIAETLQRKGCTANAIQQLMFGKSKRLDDESPIDLIRNGQSSKVAAAASGFMEGYA